MGATLSFCRTQALLWRHCLLWFCIPLALAIQMQCQAAGCVQTAAGLVSWWPGDSNANDIAGTNNGTLQDGATITNAGLVAGAFSFDGTNGLVQIPDSSDLRPTNFTIEGWVLFSSLDSPGTSVPGDEYLVFKQNRSTNLTSGSFEGFALMKVREGGQGGRRPFSIPSQQSEWPECRGSLRNRDQHRDLVSRGRGARFQFDRVVC